MDTPWANCIAAISVDDKLFTPMTLTVIGVAGGLAVLWWIINVLNAQRKIISPAAAADGYATLAKPQAAVAPGIDAHLIPVIAAAATAIVGRRVVVHRITFINMNTVSGWAEVGRTSIHQSHNLRRN